MAFGLSLAPRRFGGSVMGVSALSTAMLRRVFDGPLPGMGAFTSLCLRGLLLDVALWRAQAGWRRYLRFGESGS
jgi:hypothetical protein